MFDKHHLSHSYSRKQALEDGILIDVSQTAREAGFRYSVALTSTVWAEYVKVQDGVETQDEAQRLRDLLFSCRTIIQQCEDGDSLRFQFIVRNGNCCPQ